MEFVPFMGNLLCVSIQFFLFVMQSTGNCGHSGQKPSSTYGFCNQTITIKVYSLSKTTLNIRIDFRKKNHDQIGSGENLLDI